ncbi:hypothetical protein CLAIMM_12857 [Cladophialophora immunda]|nr:hypothetical protein CLAIMM_12857 [Cladophialophora immunda]
MHTIPFITHIHDFKKQILSDRVQSISCVRGLFGSMTLSNKSARQSICCLSRNSRTPNPSARTTIVNPRSWTSYKETIHREHLMDRQLSQGKSTNSFPPSANNGGITEEQPS